MESNGEADDSIVRRIRDSVLRLAYTPKRALAPVDEGEDRARATVRQLARSRVSQLMRQLRAAHGLTYAQIQEQTGFSQQALFDFEYKERRLSADELRMLARCYGVSLNDILGVDVE